jgi:predicted lipoprotein with Yx(FWY)xxD motif
MTRNWTLLTVSVLAFVASGLVTTAASATRESFASDAVPRATIKVAPSKLGRILVDGRGRTLYLFTIETASSIQCTSANLNCTRLWPPLLTASKPRAGAGVNARLLGSVRRTRPAGLQVTYNGHPLYFYLDDKKPGDTLGQGAFGIWYVVSPRGTAIKKR